MTSSVPTRDIIAFVGRANIDLTVRVPHRAEAGRVAFGSGLNTMPGGKSFNQAVAVTRLGGRAELIANAGADQWGRQLRDALVAAGVGTTGFRLLDDAPTGAAIIEVTPDGESYVVLAVSTQTELTRMNVSQSLRRIDPAVIVAQLDLPAPALDGVWDVPRARLLIGNLVPDHTVDRSMLSRLDLYVVNEHEAAIVLGTDPANPAEAAHELHRLGPRSVVVTAGGDGAYFSSNDETGSVAGAEVEAIDTTGAGDAFLAALALRLTQGASLANATAFANETGARAVQTEGALLPPPS